MKLCGIVAIAQNKTIGKNNTLPWHLPRDLQFFKEKTLNQTILMGRKTYDSIGRALPKRDNMVLTKQAGLEIPGCTLVHSLDEAMAQCKTDQLFIIGGATLFEQYLPKIDTLYLTIIHHDIEGDTYLDCLDLDEWQQLSTEDHKADDENEYDFSFYELKRA